MSTRRRTPTSDEQNTTPLTLVDGRRLRPGNRRKGCRFIPIAPITSVEWRAIEIAVWRQSVGLRRRHIHGASAGHDIQALENYPRHVIVRYVGKSRIDRVGSARAPGHA